MQYASISFPYRYHSRDDNDNNHEPDVETAVGFLLACKVRKMCTYYYCSFRYLNSHVDRDSFFGRRRKQRENPKCAYFVSFSRFCLVMLTRRSEFVHTFII